MRGGTESFLRGGRAGGGWTSSKLGFLVYSHFNFCYTSLPCLGRIGKEGILCLKQCSLKTAPHLDN